MKFKYPNYIPYRYGRLNRGGGGTAILIRKDFKPCDVFLPHSQHMEAITIQININKEPVILILVYNPPGKIIRLLHWNWAQSNACRLFQCQTRNRAPGRIMPLGNLLNHYYINNYIIPAPSQPTYFCGRSPAGAEILDFPIVSNALSNHSVRTQCSLSTSDHSPILLTVCGPLEADKIKPNYIFRQANWERFQNYLINNLNTQCLEGNC
jgi:hypothetical protein